MSEFGRASIHCNIPDMINGDGSRPRPDNCTEVIINVDEDAMLSLVDGGRQAWAFMIGAFMIEGLMWGFPLTYGVFQSYYQNNNTFTSNRHLSLVGTLTTAISYLGTPLIAFFTIRYPKYQKYMVWGGWLVCSLALVASSFATQVWHLIIAQGIIYGLSFLIIYYPLLNMLNSWFVERRGLAYGILFGSAGIWGLALPFVIEKMLKRYGYAITLRAYGISILVLVGPTLPLVRGRLIRQIDSRIENRIRLEVFKKPIFFAVTCSNVLQGLVFFLPNIYLPSYASAISFSPNQGSLLLSLLNISQIIGQIGMGYFSDHLGPLVLMVGSTICFFITVLCFWYLSRIFASLLIFCLLYGFFAGGYSVLYCRFVMALTDMSATGLWLYSTLEFQRGVGNLVGGSVSGVLVDDVPSTAKYRSLILFIGIAFLTSSLGGLSHWLSKAHRPSFSRQKERLPEI